MLLLKDNDFLASLCMRERNRGLELFTEIIFSCLVPSWTTRLVYETQEIAWSCLATAVVTPAP